MKPRRAVTRRGFMTTAALGAASVGLSLPSTVRSIERPREIEGTPAPSPLRLNRNESPYGLAPAAAEALKSAVDARSYRYPIDEPKALEEAIAKRYGLEKENVVLGYGSTEILKMATEAFCNSARPSREKPNRLSMSVPNRCASSMIVPRYLSDFSSNAPLLHLRSN